MTIRVFHFVDASASVGADCEQPHPPVEALQVRLTQSVHFPPSVYPRLIISGWRPQKGQPNHALQATAAPLCTFDAFWFIVPFGCAQALPSAAVPELGR